MSRKKEMTNKEALYWITEHDFDTLLAKLNRADELAREVERLKDLLKKEHGKNLLRDTFAQLTAEQKDDLQLLNYAIDGNTDDAIPYSEWAAAKNEILNRLAERTKALAFISALQTKRLAGKDLETGGLIYTLLDEYKKLSKGDNNANI